MTRIPSSRPKRWFRAAPAAHGVLLQRPQTRRRLARVEDLRAGALDRVDEAASQRCDSGQAPEEVERGALSGEYRSRTAGEARELRGLLETISLVRGRRDGDVRVERPKDGFDSRQAAHDARLLEQQPGGTRRVRGDRGLGRHVAASDVLGERGERDALEIELLGYDHRSRTGSCPGRWTTWPASSGSSLGQSARKWAPLLSVADERALGDQPRQEVRCPAEALEPGRVADEARVLPESSADVRRDYFEPLRRRRRAVLDGRIGLLERGERGPPAEDEAFEQRVRREAVRTVNPGARALAGREEPGQLGASREIGDDAAHRVVGRRRHRNRLDRGVEPRILDRPDHGREAIPVDQAEVEQRRAPRSDLTRNDVPRGELVGEALPAVVEQERTRAAQGLAEEDARAAQRRRVELDELEVGDSRSCAVGHRDPVSDRARRVRRSLPESGRPARRQQRRPCRDRSALGRHSHAARARRPQPERLLALTDRDPRMVEHSLGERMRDLASGRRAAGVHDAGARVSAFEPEPRVELDSEIGEVGDARGASLVRTETALGRLRPRPAAIVSASCRAGSSSGPTAAATPPCAR